MANPSQQNFPHALTLQQMSKLKDWHVLCRGTNAVDYEVWNAVLTVWLMGWIGCLPALIIDALWALPFCLLGVLAPQFYVYVRVRAHKTGQLRCDWLELVL